MLNKINFAVVTSGGAAGVRLYRIFGNMSFYHELIPYLGMRAHFTPFYFMTPPTPSLFFVIFRKRRSKTKRTPWENAHPNFSISHKDLVAQ